MGAWGKRIFDFLMAFVLIWVFVPLLVCLAAFVFCASGRPVFFVQERVGRHGRRFKLWKFRSMTVGEGPEVTAKDDPRQTIWGRFLRRHKLDELPQLWNVLYGDMSFVGPRPEVPTFVDLDDPLQKRVLSLRPGLVDPAVLKWLDEENMLAGRSDPESYYLAKVKPEKLRLSATYVDEASFLKDLALLGRAGVLLLRRWFS